MKAALMRNSFGLVDNWLQCLRYVVDTHQAEFTPGMSEQQKPDRLCE